MTRDIVEMCIVLVNFFRIVVSPVGDYRDEESNMTRLAQFPWKRVGLGLAVAVMSALPAIAQDANFGTLTLSPGFSAADGTAEGFTRGSFSLSSISNRDRADNLCLGFADSTPDHILVLERDFSQLTLQVDSGGGDTTLLVQGPSDRTIRCGDDTSRSNPDARIEDTDWGAGTYSVWVGSFDSGVRYDYTLTVRE